MDYYGRQRWCNGEGVRTAIEVLPIVRPLSYFRGVQPRKVFFGPFFQKEKDAAPQPPYSPNTTRHAHFSTITFCGNCVTSITMVLVKDVVYYSGAVVLLGLVITGISLLALTVNKEIKQDEFMVAVNTKYDGRVRGPFEQGRQNLRVGDTMIKFKRTVQPLEFKLSCYSKDLLQVSLDYTVMYQYVSEAIVPIILREFYDESYFLALFRSSVASSGYTTCSNFTAEDYYLQRQRAEVALLSDLRLNLQEDLTERILELQAAVGTKLPTLPVHVSQLQLTNINFPSDFNAIIATKLQTQAQQTASFNNRLSQLTAANTALIASRQQAAILTINGNQQANAILAQANATKQIVIDQWRARALAFQTVQFNLGFNDDTSLLQYWQAEPVRVNPRTILVQP